MVTKQDILNALTSDLISTKQLASKLGLNWYVAYARLSELALEGKIEKVRVGRFTFRKRKNESGEVLAE